MKKILVVSDTHGSNERLKKLIEMHKPVDVLIHLGDGEGVENIIGEWIQADTKLYMVRGNNDFFSNLERDMEVDLYGHRAFLTHGHMYGVSIGISNLADEAASRHCELAFFGHTHRPVFEGVEGVLCVNPGSLSYPRQADRRYTFVLIEVDDRGELHFHQGTMD